MKEKGVNDSFKLLYPKYVMKSCNASMIFIAILDYYLKTVINRQPQPQQHSSPSKFKSFISINSNEFYH